MQIRAYRPAAAATSLPREKVEGAINDDDFPSADLQEIKLLEILITSTLIKSYCY